MRLITPCLLALAIMAPASPAAAIDNPLDWHPPRCGVVIGDGSVTFTRDEGATTSPTIPQLQPPAYASGLAALETPNVMLAANEDRLLRSLDAGCTWLPAGTFSDGFFWRLTAAGDRAYAWTDNNSGFAVIDGTTIIERAVPVDDILGLGVDPNDQQHIRIADGTGKLYESFDGGVSWDPIGRQPFPDGYVYRAAFDPQDLDHIVMGAAIDGAAMTRNGGKTWLPATGLGPADHDVNVFSLVYASGEIVYAMGIDLDENLAGAPSDGRHIYYSTNGGRSYQRIASQHPGMVLRNGPVMAANPGDPHVVYVVFGTYFGDYGTDIYRIDARTKQLTTTHNDYDDIASIAFNPADPGVMYLGEEATPPIG